MTETLSDLAQFSWHCTVFLCEIASTIALQSIYLHYLLRYYTTHYSTTLLHYTYLKTYLNTYRSTYTPTLIPTPTHNKMSLLNGASVLIISQAATKAFTFVSNQLLVHNISPQIFGIAAYLEFIVNTVLFFSREAERMAIQRASTGSETEIRQIISNFAVLPLLLGFPISAAVFLLQRSSDLYRTVFAPLRFSTWSIALIAALILFELLSEPAYALNQYNLNFRLRSKIESSAVFAKCVVTFVGVILSKKAALESFEGLAVASFAAGQFAYSLVNLLAYSRLSGSSFKFPKPVKLELEKKLAETVFLDPAIWTVWKSLFVQMIFKHILTEGDTLLMGYLFAVTDQGIYSVVSNYGSILARLLFQPIEEFVRVSFTRTFAGKNPDVRSSYTLMENLLVFYLDLSLLIVLGGYTNGSFLLRLLLGRSEKWAKSSVFDLFPHYVLYLPFMAFNGILEAFFSSASTQAEISRFSIFMSVLSVSVLAFLYLLVKKLHWGLSGVIIANMVNMGLRVAYCLQFFFRFFQQQGITVSAKQIGLRLIGPLVTVSSAFLTQNQLFRQSSTWTQFGTSIIFCLMSLFAMVFYERKLLLPHLKRLLSKKTD